MAKAVQRLSLRAQAVAWLAQRDHSELELRRKLHRRLRDDLARDDSPESPPRPVFAASAAVSARDDTAHVSADDGVFPARGSAEARADANEQIDAVIAWLVERAYLDPQRFIESRVHLRASRHGLGRIRQELSQHGLSLDPVAAQALQSTEFERASALWQRRFGASATTPRDVARQARFLAGRGFSGDVVRQVLRAAEVALREAAPAAEPD